MRVEIRLSSRRAASPCALATNWWSPFDGQWLDQERDLKPWQWVGTRDPLGILVDPRRWQVDAYVHQDDVHRLDVGSPVRFYPEGQTRFIRGEIREIGTTRISQLEHPMLAVRYGGRLVTVNQSDALVPNPPLFRVLVQLGEAPRALRETRGHLQIEGTRRSPLRDAFNRLAAVILRESGF